MDPNKKTTKRNYFYPNCGCECEDDCELCPHCGMCVVHVEFCACKTVSDDIDESLLFDPHVEIMGG